MAFLMRLQIPYSHSKTSCKTFGPQRKCTMTSTVPSMWLLWKSVKQIRLWKLHGYLTIVHCLQDLCPHSSEQTCCCLGKEPPRGIVWLSVSTVNMIFAIGRCRRSALSRLNLFTVMPLISHLTIANREAIWIILKYYGCLRKFTKLIQLWQDRFFTMVIHQLHLPFPMKQKRIVC